MAKKKVAAVVKIQIPAGQGHARRRRSAPRSARTAWRSWTSARRTTPPTEAQRGTIVPVEITVFEDRIVHVRHSRPRPRRCSCARPPGSRRAARRPGRESVGTVTDGAGRGDRQDQDARPQRQRPRGRQAAGRRHRPVHGHRGRSDRPRSRHQHDTRPGGPRPGVRDTTEREPAMAQGQEVHRRDQAVRPRPPAPAPRGARPGEEPGQRRASTRPSSWPSASASIPARPTRWCAAPSRCPSGTGKDVRVAVFAAGDAADEARGRRRRHRRRRRPRRPGRGRACSTSTWPSPRPTSCRWSAGSAGCSAPAA